MTLAGNDPAKTVNQVRSPTHHDGMATVLDRTLGLLTSLLLAKNHHQVQRQERLQGNVVTRINTPVCITKCSNLEPKNVYREAPFHNLTPSELASISSTFFRLTPASASLLMVGLSWSHPRWSTPIAFNWRTQSGKMSTSSERRQPTSPKSGFTGTQESNAKQSRSNIKVRASILFCSSQTARCIFKCFSLPLDFYIWLWVC